MLEIVIGRNKRNMMAQAELVNVLRGQNLTGTLYIGFPILSSSDQMVTIDALLTSREHGVVAIDFCEQGTSEEQLKERQDEAYNALYRKLLAFKPLIENRRLTVQVNVLTFGPDGFCVDQQELATAGPSNLMQVFDRFPEITEDRLRFVNAAIQQVSTIKPSAKRVNVEKKDSRGGIIQRIEREIANLDKWQKSAAIECPDGPQRIRGLAGSGKTIVLAFKAAYLHSSNHDWDIAVTFHTRALYAQFKDLIRRFCFEFKSDEPDWSKLRILHSWGSARQSGIYSEIAARNSLPVRDLAYARNSFTFDEAFGGICNELLADLKSKSYVDTLFDAILIDEAQDLPQSFFELCYLSCREPKRIIWAYDELQNLGSYSMLPPSELFGINAQGEPRVPNLESPESTPKRDVVLPVCYRNTPWALVTAHAIGFGVYRSNGLVQFFDDPGLWQEIGYKVVGGAFKAGERVALQRAENSYPAYFAELLTPEDSVTWQRFETEEEQYQWIASEIYKNLSEDELEHTDILIILPDALTSKTSASKVIRALSEFEISSHLAGVTSSVDSLYQNSSIAISTIFRAKGNEAAMVYIANSEYAVRPFQASKNRSILFTAMTRSRSWVRLCGCGPGMDAVISEAQAVRQRGYSLDFQVPTPEQLATIRKIHRDMTPSELTRRSGVMKEVEQFLSMVESGELPPESLPETLLRRLKSVVGSDHEA